MAAHVLRARLWSWARVLAVSAMVVAMLAPGAGSSVAAPPTPERPHAGSKPMIIVFDLSGSMNEDDGTGTVKLEGGKAAMAKLVSEYPAGSEMGLWTYPGDESSCEPGGYVPGSELRRVEDPNQLAATIRELQADGGTPTAEALLGVGESLRKRGRSGANIVLVSDGHSTCGDPCEAARSLAGQGLDVTVNTVGFKIDEGGADELNCISDATQGSYFDADSGEELSKQLSALSVPNLVVNVSAPQAAPSGGQATITATVRNPTSTRVDDVWVGLQFTQDGAKDAILPAVIPPRFRLGSLGRDDEQTRTWKVSTGPKGKAATMSWSVSTWGASTRPILDRGTIVVTKNIDPSRGGKVLADILASPASAIIMGDSYSSGEGTYKYLDRDSNHGPTCHRSDSQYASQLLATARNPQVRNIACSGAVLAELTTPQVTDKGVVRTGSGQLQMLDRQDAPSAVFLTIGGNDIGFGTLGDQCVRSSCAKSDDLDAMVDKGLVGLAANNNLANHYAEIYRVINTDAKRRARGGQVAPVIVSPYPWVLPNAESARCGLIDRDEVNFLNWVQGRLNDTIRTQVDAARAAGAEVYYASAVVDAMNNHTACDREPYINPINGGDGIAAGGTDAVVNAMEGTSSELLAEFLHPNVAGHGAIASALASGVSRDAERPAYRDLDRRVHYDSRGAVKPTATLDVTDQVRWGVSEPLETVGDWAVRSYDGVVRAGDALRVTASRATCLGCTIKVGVESVPRTLGWLETDQNGSFDAVVTMPPDLPAGVHHLTLTTFAPDGSVSQASIEFRVKEPLPWWFWGVLAVSVVAAAGAGLMFWRSRRVPADG
ncbi:GDSL-type esterase/lipase family protein [Gordonia westfalica]|uniref:GDSL-type esterase/lipase family protein n=1 Tax=Gordonia westfalica TaxID=158898 RepID=A0ABU2GX24_9ACTN|nr:GDSL-type esterase/lipase family protein [Gordonia westfalica]MDS1116017.1 GDSL-type esterase/lipase family protein [Gordonia westfalica]